MPEERHRKKPRPKSLVEGVCITGIVGDYSSSSKVSNANKTIPDTLQKAHDDNMQTSANSSSNLFSLKKILSFHMFKTKRLNPEESHAKRSSSVQFRTERTSSPDLCSSKDDIHPSLIRGRPAKTQLFPCKSNSTTHSSDYSTSSYGSSTSSSDSSTSSSSGYSSSSSSNKVTIPPSSLHRINRTKSSPLVLQRKEKRYPNAAKGPSLSNDLDKLNQRVSNNVNEKDEDIPEVALSEDDLTCPICLDILYRPRQLTCKHSFCLLCLQNYANTCWKKFSCPSCRQYSPIPLNGVKGFTRNQFIEKSAEKMRRVRREKGAECLKCLSRDEVTACAHCGKTYCATCSSLHVLEVQRELELLRDKLVQIKEELANKKEEEESRLTRLEKSIKEAVEERIAFITQQGEELARKVQEMRDLCKEKSTGISEEIDSALNKAAVQRDSQNLEDIGKLHICLSQLLNTISKSCRSPKMSLDFSNLTLSGESSERPKIKTTEKNDISSQNDDVHIIPRDKTLLYRTKSSFSRRRWGPICERPAGVAVSPWSGDLYVTGSDACKVFIFESSGKQVGSFGSRGQADGNFLCPAGLAFSQIQNELFVTDKWKHCIHVFDSSGCFLRQIGYKGKGFGQFSSPEGIATDNKGHIYVADTCNNRVQVLDNDGLFLREMGVLTSEALGPGGKLYTKREFNEPAAVAASLDGSMVYVADSANHRIRIFDGINGRRLQVIGGRGSNKGQLESPEAVAVDERGFILVGDSGNGRVQVFHPNGHFVRCLGSKSDNKGEFGWVSGIAITREGEIVVTDFQNSHMAVF